MRWNQIWAWFDIQIELDCKTNGAVRIKFEYEYITIWLYSIWLHLYLQLFSAPLSSLQILSNNSPQKYQNFARNGNNNNNPHVVFHAGIKPMLHGCNYYYVLENCWARRCHKRADLFWPYLHLLMSILSKFGLALKILKPSFQQYYFYWMRIFHSTSCWPTPTALMSKWTEKTCYL